MRAKPQRIAALKILLDHLLDDRPEKTILIRFAPEDSLKNRANITDRTASLRKKGMSPGSEGQSGRENVNRS